MTQPPNPPYGEEPQYPQHPQAPAAPGGWPQQPEPPAAPGGWPQQPQQPGSPGAWPEQPAQQPAQPPAQQPPAPGAWSAPQAPPPPPGGQWQGGQWQGGQPQGAQWQGGQWQGGQPGVQWQGDPSATGQWEQLGGPVQPAAKPKGRGKLIAATAIVIALAAGGVATYVAVSDKTSTGSASPREAIQTIVNDLNNSDFIGVLDDLAPGERATLLNPVNDNIAQLKRLKVLSSSADPSKVAGVHFHAEGLTFNDKPVVINDHVQVVELTGGTVTLGADLASVPFTGDFLKAAFPQGVPQNSKSQKTVNVAEQVQSNGGPIRLAAQKVDGRWYPSIGYTVADNAAHDAGFTVSASDYVAPKGAPTPTDAVRGVINAALAGKPRGVIELLSPDELAAVHDYAGLILKNIPSYDPISANIKTMDFTTSPVSGGGQKVTLTALEIGLPNGSTFSYRMSGDCLDITVAGDSRHMCSADIVTEAVSGLQSFGVIQDVTQAQRDALAHAFAGLAKVGLETSETNGQWYVTPARSWFDLTNALLSGLQGNDLLEIVGLITQGR